MEPTTCTAPSSKNIFSTWPAPNPLSPRPKPKCSKRSARPDESPCNGIHFTSRFGFGSRSRIPTLPPTGSDLRFWRRIWPRRETPPVHSDYLFPLTPVTKRLSVLRAPSCPLLILIGVSIFPSLGEYLSHSQSC